MDNNKIICTKCGASPAAHYDNGAWLCHGCVFGPGTQEAFAMGCCCPPATGKVVTWCPIHGEKNKHLQGDSV